MNKRVSRAALIAASFALAACQPQPTGMAPNGTTPGAAATPGMQAMKQIAVGKGPHGMGAAQGFVYNSDTGESRLSVIDTATDAVVTTIPFPDGKPGYVKAFHDGKHVLVTDTQQGTVRVIDPAQGHKVLQTIAVGDGLDKVRIDEDDKRVLLTLTNEPKAVLLTFEADRSKAPARQDFAVGTVAGGQYKHRDGALGHGWIVNPNSGDNHVSLINLATQAVQNVTGGNNPGPVGIGAVGETAVAAIVGNAASNTVTLFDLPGGTPTTLSNVGLSPTDMVVDPQLKRAFITMAGSNEVVAIDYVAKAVVGKVAVGKRPVHIYMAPVMPAATAKLGLLDHPEEALSHELWVGNDDGASVSVVDGESLRLKATVATDQGHHKMAFWGTKAYVSNITANNVSVVDRTKLQ